MATTPRPMKWPIIKPGDNSVDKDVHKCTVPVGNWVYTKCILMLILCVGASMEVIDDAI